MKRIASVLPLLYYCCTCLAQPVFTTRVKPVVEKDQPFLLQFSLVTPDVVTAFTPPSFTGFEVKRGPDINTGIDSSKGRPVPVRNYSYTLQPVKTGRFIIRGATVLAGGKTVQSGNVTITVISKQGVLPLSSASDNDNAQVLLPGEDPNQKIKQNIFLKVQVDRTACYAGEPVLATYKLYSRLNSKSEIVKYPGFYGFTVFDVVNLSDQKVTSETINGKQFDVHTIRQVQLYPLQAGQFTIDPMEVRNEVSFSKPGSDGGVKQEITETASPDAGKDPGDTYTNNISTSPLVITIKPVPGKEKPPAFNGAVGSFTIKAGLHGSRLAKNEEGVLELTISGRGNFTQLTAPEINWPAGVEGFEPVTIDSLHKEKTPLEGSRTFRYTFISSIPGHYVLPAIRLCYFDPLRVVYNTVTAASLNVEVTNEENKQRINEENRQSVIPGRENIAAENENASRTAFIIIFSLIAAGLAYWIFYSRRKTPGEQVQQKVVLPEAEAILRPAREAAAGDAKLFLTTLYHCLWKYFEEHLKLQGNLNKDMLYDLLRRKKVPDVDINRLRDLFSTCEAGMFAGADMQPDTNLLLEDAAVIIDAVNKSLL